MTTRRGLLAFAGALLASPALVRTPGLLMPVKPWREEPPFARVTLFDGSSPAKVARVIDLPSLSRSLTLGVDRAFTLAGGKIEIFEFMGMRSADGQPALTLTIDQRPVHVAPGDAVCLEIDLGMSRALDGAFA